MVAKRQGVATDLLLAVCAIAGAALLFWGASELPPPRFEPLGSAALPRILGAAIGVMALIIAVSAIFRLRSRSEAASGIRTSASTENVSVNVEDLDNEEAPANLVERPIQGTLVLVALVLYVASLDMLRVPFLAATTLFMIAIGLILNGLRVRSVVAFGILGFLLGFGIRFVFTRYLFIDLG